VADCFRSLALLHIVETRHTHPSTLDHEYSTKGLRLELGYCRCLYSVECREEKFSETQFVPLLILGNPIYRVLGSPYAAGPILMR